MSDDEDWAMGGVSNPFLPPIDCSFPFPVSNTKY